MKISLSMIVRNAANTIRPCIISAQGAYDELVVVDTGSTDGTQDAILSVDPKARILTWDDPNKEPGHGWISDFAHARNLSADACTGEAIFWLDADDVLEHKHAHTHPGESLRSLIESFFAAGRNPPGDLIEMRYDYKRDEWGNTLLDLPRKRVWRRGKFRWKWPVHEDLVNTTFFNHVDSLQGSEFVLHRKPEKDERSSAERNLWIMQKYITAGGEMSHRLWANLAGSYLALGIYDEVIESYTKALSTAGQDAEAAYLYCLRRGDCFKRLSVFESAMRDYSRASLVFPGRRQPWIAMAETAFDSGDPDKAMALADVSEKMGGDEGSVQMSTSLQTVPIYTRARCWMAKGEYEKALPAYKALLNRFPGSPELTSAVEKLEMAMDRQRRYEALTVAAAMLKPSEATKLFRAAPADLATMPEIAKANRPERRKGQPVVVFYCGRGLETWGPSSLAKGIGGSEEAVILLAREFSALGWRVEVYAFPPTDEPMRDEYGVIWMPYYSFDPDEFCDVFIGWRQYQPHGAFHERLDRNAEQSWLWLHDTIVPEYMEGEWCERLTGIFCLSESHAADMPEKLRSKVVLTKNGLNPGFFRAGKNDPRQFIYASSPDRGLVELLRGWPAIHKEIPGSRLHIFYGFTPHYLAAMGTNPKLLEIRGEVENLRHHHGIKWHGMVGQDVLAEAFADCGFWLYPTSWHETSCITGMKAQAMGAIPITSRYQESALPETCRFDLGPPARPGKIESDAAWQSEFVSAAVEAAKRTDLGPMRAEMMAWARQAFSWSEVAAQWNQVFTAHRKDRPRPHLRPLPVVA